MTDPLEAMAADLAVLVEKHFPKGDCQERGQAMVLAAEALQVFVNYHDDYMLEQGLFDRAAAGEVIKMVRKGRTFYLGTREGVREGERRVLDSAVRLGVAIAEHKEQERKSNGFKGLQSGS